jgi:hypothetical protein
LASAPNLRWPRCACLCAHFGIDPLGVQHGAVADGSARQISRRVFAAELAFVTLTSSISSYLTAFALDQRRLVAADAGIFVGRDVLYPRTALAGHVVALATG